MPRQPLHIRLYTEPALYKAARIIGYDGVTMSDFWAQAKKLDVPQDQILPAVYDLTRGDKREEKPPRYELSAPARQACWQLLGPPPEHPWHGRLVKGPPLGSEEEVRQWRARLEEERKAKEQPQEAEAEEPQPEEGEAEPAKKAGRGRGSASRR
jgi:hypothetical protein